MRNFFEALWPRCELQGAVTIWLNPGRESLHVPIRSLLASGDSDLDELRSMAGARDVYFGLGLRRFGLDTNQQGRKVDVVALPGFALDVDFFSAVAHKAHNLPRDLDEASVLFEGEVDPSIVVHTGNGVHAYVLFDEPMLLSTDSQRTRAQKLYRRWQQPFLRKAKERGWHLDGTAEIQRVWRVPGFVNQKTNRVVEWIYP